MKSNKFTLRQLLMAVDLDEVYASINKRDCGYAQDKSKAPSLEVTVRHYSGVVKELLSKPKVKSYGMPIFLHNQEDYFDGSKYISVCLLNRKYVKAPKGAKPYGAKRGQKVPKGKYNINLNKYNRYFSMTGLPWSKIIDTPVENDSGCSNEEAVAHILWELTFDGWTEEEVAKKTKALVETFKNVEKEIKEGKCVTLPPKKKGGLKVVIPDSVSQKLIDIANKKKY